MTLLICILLFSPDVSVLSWLCLVRFCFSVELQLLQILNQYLLWKLLNSSHKLSCVKKNCNIAEESKVGKERETVWVMVCLQLSWVYKGTTRTDISIHLQNWQIPELTHLWLPNGKHKAFQNPKWKYYSAQIKYILTKLLYSMVVFSISGTLIWMIFKFQEQQIGWKWAIIAFFFFKAEH